MREVQEKKLRHHNGHNLSQLPVFQPLQFEAIVWHLLQLY